LTESNSEAELDDEDESARQGAEETVDSRGLNREWRLAGKGIDGSQPAHAQNTSGVVNGLAAVA